MDANTARVQCPKCRANNFIGQPRCWQCGASLPPPEAIHGAPAMPSAPFAVPSDGGPAWAVAAVLGLIATLACLLVFAINARNRQAAQEPPPVSAELRALQQERARLENQPSHNISDVNNLDPNSPLAQAERKKREMEQKLRDRAGTEMPSASPAPGGIIPPVP